MLLTEIEAAKQIRDGQLPSPYQFSNMWLVNLRITGTGMAYRAEEKEFVWRSPQTYLNPQFWNVAPEYPSSSTIPKAKPLKTWANGRALLAPSCCRIFAVTRCGAYAGFTGRKSSITSRKPGGDIHQPVGCVLWCVRWGRSS